MIFNCAGIHYPEHRGSGSHVASEIGTNDGPLVVALVLAYGILSRIVSADARLFLVGPPFYCSYEPHFMFQPRIRISKLMTSHERALGSVERVDESRRPWPGLGHLTCGWRITTPTCELCGGYFFLFSPLL